MGLSPINPIIRFSNSTLSDYFYSDYNKKKRSSIDYSVSINKSLIAESGVANITKDSQGNEYINQYMIMNDIGKYLFLFIYINIEEIMALLNFVLILDYIEKLL